MTAADGESALARLRQRDVDIVLTDWMMPGLQGPELVSQIRGLDGGRYLYIIMCTVKGRSRNIVEGIAAGADDYLAKPFDPDVLKVRIEAAARLIRLQRSLRATNERLEQGLSQARQTLEGMLPSSRSQPLCDLDWIFRPCAHIGGDLFNACALDDHRLSLYSFDVAGHGIASALFAVTLGNMLRPRLAYNGRRVPCSNNNAKPCCSASSTFNHEDLGSPAEVAEFLNERFPLEPPKDAYFTLFYGVLDRQRGVLDWVRAGHPPALLVRGEEVETLEAGDPPIGFIEDHEFTRHTTSISAGDRLVLYSDGLTEASSPSGELFGTARLRGVIEEHAGAPLGTLVREVERSVYAYQGSEQLADDLSMLVVEPK